MTAREATIKRIIEAGGTWPPKPTIVPWGHTGRWAPIVRYQKADL